MSNCMSICCCSVCFSFSASSSSFDGAYGKAEMACFSRLCSYWMCTLCDTNDILHQTHALHADTIFTSAALSASISRNAPMHRCRKLAGNSSSISSAIPVSAPAELRSLPDFAVCTCSGEDQGEVQYKVEKTVVTRLCPTHHLRRQHAAAI